MSLKVEEMDMDNLSKDEKQYLRDRPWLPQPPGDPRYAHAASDWNEDEVETVPLDAFGVPLVADDEAGQGEGPVDEDGDPIKLDEAGDFAAYDWGRMTNTRLKEFCEAYELPKSGNKADLVARLEEYDELAAANPEA